MTVGLFLFLGASALPGRALLGSICLLLRSHQGGACVGTLVFSIPFLVPIFDCLTPSTPSLETTNEIKESVGSLHDLVFLLFL